MPAGRPTLYNEELAKKYCETLATSRLGMRKLCETRADFPDETTIRSWCIKYPEFNRMYWIAKEQQIDFMASDLSEIAEEVKSYVDDAGRIRIDPPSVGMAKNKMDAVKFTAARLMPKKWDENKTRDDLIISQAESIAKLNELVAKLAPKDKSDV